MDIDRREFLKKGALASGGLFLSGLWKASPAFGKGVSEARKLPAVLGGEKAHPGSWPKWPKWKGTAWDEKMIAVLRSGVWSRAKYTEQFESEWAKMVGVKRCLTTVNGTNALIVALNQAGIGIGDEVIVTPYTFVATVQAILLNGAIPVFADIDRNTFQIDPEKIREKITPRTKAILPVHILGMPADMDRIMAIAREHQLVVIEDACQAHLAEYDGKRVGSIGFAACFSFQNSKNIPIGEGGAIVSDDDAFMDRCYSYHNLGLPTGTQAGSLSGAFMVGTKVRFSEYQAAIGLLQMEDAIREADLRWENGQYLTTQLKGIKGIETIQLYPKVNKAVFHLYPFRFIQDEFGGMSRDLFLRCMRAEGIPCGSGYAPLETQPFIKAAFESRLFQAVYDAATLDYEAYREANRCPENDLLCNEEAVWIAQSLLLTDHAAMDDIAMAVEKIRKHADKIMKRYNP